MNMDPTAAIELDDGTAVAGGWSSDPQVVEAVCGDLAAAGHELDLIKAAGNLFEEPDLEASVFLWDAELKVLGRILEPWNQNPIGACVGFGSTWAAQDVLLNEIAAGEPEEWPGAELCPEVTYVGSRNEAWPANYGRLRGEGSVGVAAALWFTRFGAVKRAVYGDADLTRYNRRWVYDWQFAGIPDHLGIEDEARLHPISTSARINTFADAWAGIGARKGAYFCSIQGFSMNADSDGFAIPRGSWGHCQVIRGRCVAKKNGRWVRSLIGQNSWRDSDGGRIQHPANGPVRIELKDRGVITLPPGMILYDEDVMSSMFAERDSFLLAGLTGWKRLTIDMNPLKG